MKTRFVSWYLTRGRRLRLLPFGPFGLKAGAAFCRCVCSIVVVIVPLIQRTTLGAGRPVTRVLSNVEVPDLIPASTLTRALV